MEGNQNYMGCGLSLCVIFCKIFFSL